MGYYCCSEPSLKIYLYSVCYPARFVHSGSIEAIWNPCSGIQPTSSIVSQYPISISRCPPEMPNLTLSFLRHIHCIISSQPFSKPIDHTPHMPFLSLSPSHPPYPLPVTCFTTTFALLILSKPSHPPFAVRLYASLNFHIQRS